jgi:hypothetical protein
MPRSTSDNTIELLGLAVDKSIRISLIKDTLYSSLSTGGK